jgi:hypothetical protein
MYYLIDNNDGSFYLENYYDTFLYMEPAGDVKNGPGQGSWGQWEFVLVDADAWTYCLRSKA